MQGLGFFEGSYKSYFKGVWGVGFSGSRAFRVFF